MSRSNAIRTDLKAIVDNFRVSELVTVCTVAGVSRNGKKTELLSRIYNLIRDPVPTHVEKKIMELYKICFPNHPMPAPPSRPENNRNAHNLANIQIPKPPTASYRPPDHMNSSQFQSTNLKRQPAPPQSHQMTVPPPGAEHPDVKFKVIPFFDLMDTIFKPLCLTPHNVNSTYQDAYFNFTLSAHHLDQIQKSPRVNVHGQNGSIVDKTHQVQVQMRFCLMETSCAQLDNYPPYINVRVNGKAVDLPPVLPQSKAGQPPKRSPKPLNVTKFIKFDHQVNHVQIQWTTEFARTWVCSVFLVKENDSAELLKRLKAKGPRSADHTRALIKDKLKIDPDSEIAMTTLRASLNCPLGVCRMTMPVRSKQCSHVQCFDAQFYVKMNEKRPAWQCPVCGKEAPFSELMLDGYFLEVLDSSTYECTEIYCYDNGSWEPIDGDKRQFQTIGTPQSSKTVSMTPAPGTDLTSPVKVEDSPGHSRNNCTPVEPQKKTSINVSKAPSVTDPKETCNSKNTESSATTPQEEEHAEPPEVVDLCSDSEDDEPLAKQIPPARPVSAISLSSASPADSNPNSGGGMHNPKNNSPFPSPPLVATSEALRSSSAHPQSNTDRHFPETRKRSMTQMNSAARYAGYGEEEPYSKIVSNPHSNSQSRAFLNPPLVNPHMAIGVGSSNRGIGSSAGPNNHPLMPTFLNDAMPATNSPAGHSVDSYGRPKLNPNAPSFNPYTSYGFDPRRGLMNHPQQQLQHRDTYSAMGSTAIPPPPARPGAPNESYETVQSNPYFPPPPMRPKEFNIIELE
ncbi:E3 SUMO-protein ligase PIAS2-like isoform X2 [Symsagittifera roscoffensis]|uniref:E3 SUMO-protein ligase PIAS2-like isoform X2 n=1 Tax=Symsagittifera roscoffensis TaxID=84072 RepID=UPI00307B7C10